MEATSRRARREAQRVLRETGHSLPVQVERIAKHYGVTIRVRSMENSVSGMLVVKDGYAIIGVNKNHPPNRRRFSIAHELGHFFLHRHSSHIFIDRAPVFFRNSRSSDGTQLQEIDANAFAAELLMPESIVREKLTDQALDPFDEKAVRPLALEFGVSTQALTIRLATLGLIAV